MPEIHDFEEYIIYSWRSEQIKEQIRKNKHVKRIKENLKKKKLEKRKNF